VAFAVSGYGVWHALHPRIKEVTVTIPNLPESWRGQKIAQISDVHLGHVYRADFLQKVVEQINQAQPKIVVVTGDLFDGMDGDLDTLAKPLDTLDAKLGVLFVGGNHETYLGTAKTLDILTKTKVRILRSEVVDKDGLLFVGIAYPEQGDNMSVVQTLASLQSSYVGKPTVLLCHAPSHIEEVAQMNIHLQLSGHTHQGQQFPFQWVTNLVHQGFDYGLYILGDYSLYVTSGVGTWGPTMRIGTQSEIVIITLQ
jgi:predicted MPP superfamily phosphohydrolase